MRWQGASRGAVAGDVLLYIVIRKRVPRLLCTST